MKFDRYTLESAGDRAPYVLVGHCGLVRKAVRMFASMKEALVRHPKIEVLRRIAKRDIEIFALKGHVGSEPKRWI